MGKRGELEILIDTMKILRPNPGKTITYIHYESRLCYPRTKEILNKLLAKDLIETEIRQTSPDEQKRECIYYKLSTHGRHFLSLWMPLENLILGPIPNTPKEDSN